MLCLGDRIHNACVRVCVCVPYVLYIWPKCNFPYSQLNKCIFNQLSYWAMRVHANASTLIVFCNEPRGLIDRQVQVLQTDDCVLAQDTSKHAHKSAIFWIPTGIAIWWSLAFKSSKPYVKSYPPSKHHELYTITYLLLINSRDKIAHSLQKSGSEKKMLIKS